MALDQVRPPFNGRASVNAGALLYQDFIFFGRKILAGGKSQFVFPFLRLRIWRNLAERGISWLPFKPVRVKKRFLPC